MYVSTESQQQLASETKQASSNQLGAMYCGDLNYDWYKQYWQPAVIHEYYPWYAGVSIIHEDKYQKAFAIAKMLLKDKMLANAKVVDFIALVEKIAGIL